MRVFLVGFMCSGKSRIGRELATRMALPFRDIDRVIEQRIGPITPWFQKNGEEAFRKEERAVLTELLQEEDIIISCGGGTPFSYDNMQRMLAAGTVVFLDVPLDVLVERATRTGGDRPLLFGLKGKELEERIAALLAERLPTYGQAHMRVRATDTPDVVAGRIEQALRPQER